MLNRKAASDSASKHLIELVPVEGTPLVEEHFFADGVWQITLSFTPAVSSPRAAAPGKEYKSFAIDGRTGEVLSMKIRSQRA
jgi:hypothetical protein